MAEDEKKGSEEHVGWRVPAVWRRLSRTDIERRFDRRIRDAWSGERPPAVDVFVLDREVHVQVDLPGVDEADVRARVEGEMLSIEAERRIRPPDVGATPAALERPRGPFRREVPLPREVPRPRIFFRLEAGVLYVRVAPDDSP